MMSPVTRVWIEALLRLAKGMIAETEKWLKAQGRQMAYARMTEGAVYAQRWGNAIGPGRDGWVCQLCSRPELAPAGTLRTGDGGCTVIFDSALGLLRHLEAHRAAGDEIPSRALEELQSESVGV